MSEKKKLYLLDAYALIFRAYYAFIRNPRFNSKGMNTSAVFGFTNALLDVLNNHHPTHIAVAFDPPGGTFRSTDFAAYKANREETPEDIKRSVPYIKAIIDGFRIPVIEVANYEADDVIGTLAKKAEQEGYEVYMVTPDKDYGQLVSENIKIHRPPKNGGDLEIWGIKEVCEKFEVQNQLQIIDLLGLAGDAVDNIPGIPGVGMKTAQKLLAQYQSVEGVIANVDELKGKLQERVREFSEQALLSKQLATIHLGVPVAFEPEKLILEEPDKEKLLAVFSDLEFRTLSQRLLGEKVQTQVKVGAQMDLFGDSNNGNTAEYATPETSTSIEHNYQLTDTADKRATLIKYLSGKKAFCFDTETTGLDTSEAELVGIAFSCKAGEGFYVPMPENRKAADFILADFKPLFADEKILKIAHNLKYDLTILKWYGIEIKQPMFDTMLAHYLIEPDMRHGMDLLSETYLHYRPISIEELIGKKGKDQKNMRDIPVEQVKEYAAEDADITFRLYELFSSKLDETKTRQLFETIEMPLVSVLGAMETEGIKINSELLAKYSAELTQEILGFEEKILNLAGVPFNIASPKQLGEVLFDHLKIGDKPKKTKTGQYATGEEVLETLKGEHEIIDLILEYRQTQKLKSTYVDSLPLLVNPKTGRIHSTFNQAIAATGRLSSVNPNLQNIPIRTERGRKVREAFIPRDENHVLLAADYSQIELRVIASISGDKAMIEAFENDEDIHRATAAKIFGVPLDEVTREQRGNAKTVNFGIIYGVSAFGLSQQTNLSRSEAREVIDSYFETYPGIKNYMTERIDFAKQYGYVETIMGRRRYLKDINSANAVVRGQAERNAINAPIQGSAADIIKKAMIDIHDEFEKQSFKSRMVLQVHDELVFDAHKDEIDIIRPLIVDKMQNAVKLSVKLKVDVGLGNNWLEAH
jgi:DNA polymerase-1